MNKAFNNFSWENYPSDKSPLDEVHLMIINNGLDEVDNRVIVLENTKATKVEVSTLFNGVSLDEQTGIITFTRKNGSTVSIDTPMEKIQTGIYYNPATEKLVLPLIDGTSMEVDLSRLMKFDEFIDSGTIAFSVKPNGTVTAIVKEGSIEEKHLQPNYLADIKIESAKAEASRDAAEESASEAEYDAKLAQSYANGTGGSRPEENTDNAKYYSEQAKKALESLEQAGNVNGVKGNEESDYRTGLVNLTAENIGALPLEGNAVSSNFPFGFDSRSGSLWGNQTGEYVTAWDVNGCAIQFRKNNPADGRLSVLTDGYFYQQEGMKRCLDESDKLPGNIGNNGTGGMSVGIGLELNKFRTLITENTFSVTIQNSLWGLTEKHLYGETYYGISATAQSSVAPYLSQYVGDTLEDAEKIVSFPDTIINTGIGSYYGTYVESATDILILYNDEETARNILDGVSAAAVSVSVDGYTEPSTDFYQTILGMYNKYYNAYAPGSVPLFSIGNGTGTSASARRNVFRVNSNAAVYLGAGGAYNSSGADHAEFVKEWWDGNPDNEDRVGYFVTVKDGLLYKAEPEDYISGITSGNPCVVGNADEEYFWKYKKDEFNRPVMETVPEEIQETDEEGCPVFDEKTGEPVVIKTGNMVKQPKIAEKYNPAMQESYVERKDRKEWDYVGMLGVLPVRDDGTCVPGRFCRCGGAGIATLADKRGLDTFFVLERVAPNIVSVEMRGI